MGYRVIRFRGDNDREEAMTMLKQAKEMIEEACEIIKQADVSERNEMGYRRDSRGRYMSRRDWEEPDYRGRYGY